jgi:hypothetical protein
MTPEQQRAAQAIAWCLQVMAGWGALSVPAVAVMVWRTRTARPGRQLEVTR